MLLEEDSTILEKESSFYDFPVTEENLLQLGCEEISYSHGFSSWKITYRERVKEFDVGYYYGKTQARIYLKRYCDERKTSWYAYTTEYAHTIRELLNWIDAELDFFKDHPIEDPTTEEYKENQKRIHEQFINYNPGWDYRMKQWNKANQELLNDYNEGQCY